MATSERRWLCHELALRRRDVKRKTLWLLFIRNNLWATDHYNQCSNCPIRSGEVGQPLHLEVGVSCGSYEEVGVTWQQMMK